MASPFRMGKHFLFLFLLIVPVHLFSQANEPDQVRQKWQETGTGDSLRLYRSLGLAFRDIVQFDSAYHWFREAERFAHKTKQPVAAALALKSLGKTYLEQGNRDSAEAVYARSLAIDRNLENPASLAASLNNIGLAYYLNNDYRSGIRHIQESQQIYRELGNDSLLAISLLNLGIEYKRMGYLGLAVEELEEGLKVLGPVGKDLVRAYLINTLANIRRSQGNPDGALPLHKEALKLRIELKKKGPIADSYNNLGNTYLDLDSLNLSRKFLMLALDLKQEIGNERSEVTTLRNLGRLELKQQNWHKARAHFDTSIKRGIKTKHLSGAAESANFLARLFHVNQSFVAEDSILQLGEQFAAKAGAGDSWLENLEMQKALQVALGNLDLALQLSDRYLIVRDSLKGKGDQRALGDIIIGYEKARDQFEKDQLIRDRQWTLAGGILVILLVSGFFMARFRYKQKAIGLLREKNKEIKARNHQIELLFRELNHRVKNNLMVISSLLKLQANQLTDETAKEAIREGRNRVEAMSLIHQKLYQNAQISHISLSEYIRKLIPNLLASYGHSTHSVNLELEVADEKITVDTAVPLGLVVNELVSNAFKYAFVSVPTPWLKVSLQAEGEQFVLKVHDNGPGLPEGFDYRNSGSFGLKLVNSLTRQMRGELKVTNEQGACFQLTVTDTPNPQKKQANG